MKKPSGVRRLVLGGEGFMTRPSDLRVRLVARWALLAVALLCVPCVQAALLPGADVGGAVDSDDTFLPALLRDLRRRGLLRPEGNVVIFDDMIAGDRSATLPDSSTDFVFSSSAVDFRRIDRILKAGGVVAVRSGSNPPDCFLPPANYRTAYVGRIGSDAVVAMRKSFASGEGGMRLRRLLAVPAAANGGRAGRVPAAGVRRGGGKGGRRQRHGVVRAELPPEGARLRGDPGGGGGGRRRGIGGEGGYIIIACRVAAEERAGGGVRGGKGGGGGGGGSDGGGSDRSCRRALPRVRSPVVGRGREGEGGEERPAAGVLGVPRALREAKGRGRRGSPVVELLKQ